MTITDVCRLSDEVRSGELLISVFLDQAILNPKSKEADRDFVLRATYPTAPLRSLLEHVAQKLNGNHPKGSAVVRGTYGSGKSHALLALYHVVGAGKDGQGTLRAWNVKATLPSRVRVAAVQLRSENPLTLWELLFERAEKHDLNEQVRDYPTREQWASLGREMPTLLIVDELEQWFEAQSALEQARTKSALANLLEAAELPDVPLAVALAVYGTNNDLMAVINRVQPPVWDVGTAGDRQKIVRHLKSAVTRETGAATDEVGRAVVELVNDSEAVVEQDDARYPDDGALSGRMLSNDAKVWLAEHAPPDDRRARARILELVQGAGEDGITWANVQAHLNAEGITAPAIERAAERLMAEADGLVECYDANAQMVIREWGLLTATTVLRLRKEVPPPLPTGWKPFHVSIQPYRLPMSTHLLLGEFDNKLAHGCHIKEVRFTARPPDSATDPLFGAGEQAGQLARVQVEHKLTWHFEQPASKEELLNLVANLLGELGEKGEVIVEADIQGEVPRDVA